MSKNPSPAALFASRMGTNPLWGGLAFWGAGILFCLIAWQVHKVNHTAGSILLGLSTFVNIFCFMQGLNRLRRAAARMSTIYRAARMGLSADTVYSRAGYVVTDDTRGYLVCNGHIADYRSITKIICKSTWLAHKLELYGCGRMPLIVGFPDRQTLFVAGEKLCTSIRMLTGSKPEYIIHDELAPPPAPTSTTTSDQG